MPTRSRRRCTHCGHPTTTSPCPTCEQRRKTAVNRRRPNPTSLGYDQQHRAFRDAVLTRDKWCTCPGCPSCYHKAPGSPCIRSSKHADHWPETRRQLEARGANPNDPRHGRGLCHPCHSHWTASRGGGFGNPTKDTPVPTRARRRCLHPDCGQLVERQGYCANHPPVKTTIISGPPCSGKSRYVRDHAQPGDLIVDWDDLAHALTGQPAHTKTPAELIGYIAEARDAIIARLEQRRPNDVRAAWIVVSDPSDATSLARRTAGSVVEMSTTVDECLERLHDDPDGRDVEELERVIRSWHNRPRHHAP